VEIDVFLFSLIGAALAVGVGVVVKVIFDRLANADRATYKSGVVRINTHELVIGSIVASLVVIPAVVGIGFSISKSNTMSYQEFYNGLEATATVQQVTCERDGSCQYEYECDPYRVMVTKYRTVSDGKGGTKSEPYQDWETRYHQCPYVDYELNHYVNDTLGDNHLIGGTRFPVNAEKHKWRGNKSLPNVEEGAPALWTEAKARIDAGNPGGVTKTAKYDNYIQASQNDIYAKHSGDIASYLTDGLLPVVPTDVFDYYQANKFQTVKRKSVDTKAWNEALGRFNGHLGSDRRGDLHIVAVDAGVVDSPDQYSLALESYWQSPDLGKNTLSKNGIAVVLGVEDDTVKWARAFTGMPAGNERVVVDINNDLPGSPFTPEAVLGAAGTGKTKTAVAPVPAEQSGADKLTELGQTVTGQAPTAAPDATTTTPAATTAKSLDEVMLAAGGGYERVHMADYEYLKSEIQASTASKVWVTVIGLFLSAGIWALMLYVEFTIPLPAGWAKGKNDD
jgi:hypothetical protein